jgi:hypothetical protein
MTMEDHGKRTSISLPHASASASPIGLEDENRKKHLGFRACKTLCY